jgi:hypothetical protein
VYAVSPLGVVFALTMPGMLSDDVKLSVGICERCAYATLLWWMVVVLSPGRVLMSLAARGYVQCGSVQHGETRLMCCVKGPISLH